MVQVTKAGLRAGPEQHADLLEVWSIIASSRRGHLLPRPRIGEYLVRMAVRGGPGRVAAAREAAPPAVLRQPLQRAVMGSSSSERHAARVPGAVHPRRACVRRFLMACFEAIAFCLDHAASSSIVPNFDGQTPCAGLEDDWRALAPDGSLDGGPGHLVAVARSMAITITIT